MGEGQLTIRAAELPVDREVLLSLVHEYLEWLDMDLSYRGFTQEMAAFDHRFTLPSGMFLIAELDGQPAGCGGFLRHPGNRAELKPRSSVRTIAGSRLANVWWRRSSSRPAPSVSIC